MKLYTVISEILCLHIMCKLKTVWSSKTQESLVW